MATRSLNLAANPLLPAKLTRETRDIASTQALQADLTRHHESLQQLLVQQQQRSCAREEEAKVCNILWAHADRDGSGVLDTPQVEAFFAAAGVKPIHMALILQLARADTSRPLVRRDFGIAMGLLALQQRGAVLSIEALAASVVALIPVLPLMGPYATLSRHDSSSGLLLSSTASISFNSSPPAVARIVRRPSTDPMELWSIEDVCAHFERFSTISDDPLLAHREAERIAKVVGNEAIDGAALNSMSPEEIRSVLALPFGVVKKHSNWLLSQHMVPGPSVLPRTLQDTLAALLPGADAVTACLELVRAQGLSTTLAVLREQRRQKTAFWRELTSDALYPTLKEL